MHIEFYLKAVPWKKKNVVSKEVDSGLAVREFFHAYSPDKVIKQGAVVPRVSIEGQVDNDIKAQNAEEYAAFAELVKEQESELYEAARENPGVKIYPRLIDMQSSQKISEETVEA